MRVRLTIDKLGRIDHAELELRPLTVLVGENGVNKSWTAYAAYAALRHFALDRLQRPGMGGQVTGLSRAEDAMASFPGPDSPLPWAWSARIDHDGYEPTAAYSLDARTLSQVIGADVAKGARAALGDVAESEWPLVEAVEVDVETTAGQFAVDLSYVGSAPARWVSRARDRNDVLTAMALAIDHMRRARFARAALMPVERVLHGGPVPSDGGPVDHMAWWIQLAADRLHRGRPDNAGQFPGSSAVTGTSLEVGEALGLTEVRGDARTPLRAAATMTRGLAALDLYLRTLARPGDWIIIDEPELSAHPAGQVAIAEWLAVLVTKGLRFIITTHSPYLLDHLESLVVARHGGPAAMARVRARRPEVPDEAFLLPADLAVYDFVDRGRHVDVRNAYDWTQPAVTTSTFGRVSDMVMELMIDAGEP